MSFLPDRFTVRLILALLALGCGIASGFGAQTATKEEQIKAAFLYQITKFVDWAPESFADESSPIVIGVLGSPTIRAEAEKAARGRKVNGRPLVVRAVDPANPSPLHLLFIANDARAEALEHEKAWRLPRVLTIADSRDLGIPGMIMTFTRDGDNVRFEIDHAEAERMRVKLSAQLLQLAKKVGKPSSS